MGPISESKPDATEPGIKNNRRCFWAAPASGMYRTPFQIERVDGVAVSGRSRCRTRETVTGDQLAPVGVAI